MVNLPTGTVTFLFTDIEGSTKLAQEYPKRWEFLRERHHAILQSAMDAHDGHIFQIVGDAFCVAFHTALDALNAATRSQLDSCSEDWDDTPIKVRMGIHTGKAEIQQDGQYHGYLAMSRVQRLMSAGHGGQVLISAAAHELLLEELPENLSLRDLGEQRLKDLIRPEHIFQLVIPNLPVDFPPLKTLDALPNNLPLQLTSFIGREKEIGELKELITRTRLVTLTGVGGTGKTRLALQVGADVLDDFRDGVWLVELAPLSDPTFLQQTLLTTLGLREQAGRAFLDILKDYLSRKKLLLLLDNCEHLIESCAQLADVILHAAPQLKILSTSREALGIAGESIYPVRSLSLPDSYQSSPDTLGQYDAVQLFIDRAVAVQPNFQVTNENAPAVAQICARLDGIPLAIELAAARVKGLSVEQIALRLNDRFRLLTGGSRTALPRQRTLQATIDWSYNLLSEEERVLMHRLSIFTGGWTLEAAEQVCVGDALLLDQIVDLLMHLVDKSLVVAEMNGENPRYHMLETIRQYAQEKLDEYGPSNVTRDRHLEYFRALAEQAKPHLRSSQQLVWLDRLEAEYDNIRAALVWALEGGSVEAGIDLAADLASGWFWTNRDHRREGRDFIEKLLNKPQLTDRISVLAQGHLAAAMVIANPLDLLAAYRHAEESESLWLQLGPVSQAEVAEVRNWRLFGYVELNYDHLVEDDLIRVRRLYKENLNFFQDAGDRWMSAITYSCIGMELWRSGDFESARQAYIQCLALFQECGDNLSVGKTAASLGILALEEGNYEEARTRLEESLSIFRQMRVNSDELLWLLGAIAIREGDYARAKAWYSECLLLDLRLGVTNQIPECLIGFAGIALAETRFQRAAQLVGAVEAWVEARPGPLEHIDQAELEQLTEVLHTELGGEKFEELANEGRQMTMEQAIELAVEEIHE